MTAVLSQLDFDIRLVGDDLALAALRDDWNALAGSVPFRRYEWLAAWWRHFRRPSDELFVPLVYDADGQIIGLAPWYIARDRWLGRVVRFLGSGKVCSEYVTVLAAAGAEELVAHTLAEWLATEAAARWDAVDLDGVEADDRALCELAGELVPGGHAFFQRNRERTWRVRLASSWNEFLGRLSKGRRAKVRVHERRLDHDNVSVRIADDPETLRQGLDIFHQLHQTRRETMGDGGCLSLPGFDAFLHDTAAELLEAGRLRLQWVEVGGQPAAVEFDLLGDETLYYYQTGMNPEMAEISPGWLLQVASLKRAIDDGLTYFDFLRGDEAYKASWGAQPRQLAQICVASRRPLSRLRHGAWRTAAEVKNRWFQGKKADAGRNDE